MYLRLKLLRRNSEHIIDIYKSLFETFRWQVDSYWQRSSYFAAFETAAIAGCWYLLDKDNKWLWAGFSVSILGTALTIVWFLNNHKTHAYVEYWWNALPLIEGPLGVNLARGQRGGGCIRYSYLVQAVPVMFFLAWSALLVWGLRALKLL